jgi:hypothetical protein
MAIQADTSRVQYTGNASTTQAYPVPFPFFSATHLRCIVTTNGVDAPMNFVATGEGNPNGGSLTTVTAVPATSTVTIYREVPATQTTSYVEGGDFPAASHERALDKLTMLVQQVIRLGQRTLRLPESQNSPNEIPSPTAGTQTLTATDGRLGWSPTVPVPSVPSNAGTFVFGTTGQNILPTWQPLPQFQSQDITNAVLDAADGEYVSQQRYFSPHALQRTLSILHRMETKQQSGTLVFLGVGDSMAHRKPTWISRYLFNRYEIKGACLKGLVTRSFGDVDATTFDQTKPAEFNYWENGEIAKVRTNGSVQYGLLDGLGTSAGFILSNEITIYSVARSGGGTFKVQYSTDGTNWTDVPELNNVSTSAGSAIGLVSKATVATAGFYRWRVLGLSGESWIIGAKAINTLNNGVVFGLITRGGMTIAQSNTVSSAIFNPIIADISPDLVMWEQKDDPSDYVNGLPTYLDRWANAGVQPDWVLVGTNDSIVNDVGSATVRATIKSVADARKLGYFDFNGLVGGWDGIVKMGWHIPDAVHLADDAHQVGAALFINNSGINLTYNSIAWRMRTSDGNQKIYAIGPHDDANLNTNNVYYNFQGSRNSSIGIRLIENINNSAVPGWALTKVSNADANHPNALIVQGGNNNDGRIVVDGSGNVVLRSSGTGETWPRTERVWAGTTSPNFHVATLNHNYRHPTFLDDTNMTGYILNAAYRSSTVSALDHRGNLLCLADGGGLSIKAGGEKAKAGTVSLVSGTATVASKSVKNNSLIFLTAQSGSATGDLRVSSRTAGTSFTITSSNASDNRSIAWLIIDVL